MVASLQGKDSPPAGLKATQEFFRLFMVPGMQHCSGGPGASSFDMLSALEDWVENGKPPQTVLASTLRGGKATRRHPLCLYPASAVLSGRGSADDAANTVARVQ